MSEYTTSETSNDDSYSDSEGTYTLTTTSDSGEDDVETVDKNGTVICENGAYRNGTTVVAGTQTPFEHEDFFIRPCDTGTYEIKMKGGRLTFTGFTRTATPSSFSSQSNGSKIVSARTWNPSTSSDDSKIPAKVDKQIVSFARFRKLPVVRCAAGVYNVAKTNKFLGWAFTAGEAAARMAVAPVTKMAAPFTYMCSVPVNCVDRALCKGLDMAEVLFPCIFLQPCQMCWSLNTCFANDVTD